MSEVSVSPQYSPGETSENHDKLIGQLVTRVLSSVIQRCVVSRKSTDVSDEYNASNFKVE
jgi:hypothetical protein